MKAASFVILIGLMTTPVFARLGDTWDQAEARYGFPKSEKPSQWIAPLLKGAKELTFEYHGWRIRCSLLMATDGKSYVVREEYTKIPTSTAGPIIADYERDAIFKGEGGIAKWTEKKSGALSLNPMKVVQNQLAHTLTGRTWVRTDGAIAVHTLGGVTVRLDLPQSFKYEKEFKEIKERKAKAAVPKF